MKTASYKAPLPNPPRTRVHIRKPADAIRLLNRVINGVFDDSLPTDKARCIVYAASTIAKIYEIGELEERLQRLEERTNVA